jgi:hypothetical protein
MKIIRTCVFAVLATSLVACGSTRDGGAGAVEPYPLDDCLVMDSALGSMGDPVTLVYQGRELKFCCEPCVAAFEQDPGYYLGKLDEAIAAQKD